MSGRVDLRFAAPDAAAFMADLDDFCAAVKASRIVATDEEGNDVLPPLSCPDNLDDEGKVAEEGTTAVNILVTPDLPAIPGVYDEDGTEVVPPVGRGWHCDVRIAERDVRRPTRRYLAVAVAIRQWFAPMEEVDHNTPETVQDAYGVAPRKVHRTARGCALIHPAPQVPKTGFAG